MTDSQNQQNTENNQNLQYLCTPISVPSGYILIPYFPAANNYSNSNLKANIPMPAMPDPAVAPSYNYASPNAPSLNTSPLAPQNILPEAVLIPNPATVSTIELFKLPMIIFAVLLLVGFFGYKFLNNFITAQGQASIISTGQALTIPVQPSVETAKEEPEKESDNPPAAPAEVKNDVAKILIPR